MSSDGSDDDIPGLESVSSSEVSGLKRESRDHNLSTSPHGPHFVHGVDQCFIMNIQLYRE